MNKTMTININRCDDGYYIQAEPGELPEEGRLHETRAKAIDALYAMYDNDTWHLRHHNGIYTINI